MKHKNKRMFGKNVDERSNAEAKAVFELAIPNSKWNLQLMIYVHEEIS